MPTAAWSTKCQSPTKTLVQRQISNGTKSSNTKPISPPRSKTANSKCRSPAETANSSPAGKASVKNGSASPGPEKGSTVPRVVAAEMKSTVRKSTHESSRLSSASGLQHFPSDGSPGSHSTKKELTRCSSTEGALERKGYASRPSSRQSAVPPASRNGKSELKRCFSSEGILERKGMGQKNLSLSRKPSGENLSSHSETSKTNAKQTTNQRKTSLPNSYRVNKTVIKNNVTSASKDPKSKPKYISSGLKSTIEIPCNVERENPSEVKSVIEITDYETKEDETPPEIPPYPSFESIGIPSKNLSTIIAVDFVTNPEDLASSPPPAHASSTIQVVQDTAEEPLSSTIIAVNYDVSTEVNKPQALPQCNTQIFNGKSSVWSRLQSKTHGQQPPSTNVAVNINIKEEIDHQWNTYPPLPPPPVPPLPSLLNEDIFRMNENTELPTPPPPVLPPRRNRSSSVHEVSSAQGSRIPLIIPPSLVSLPAADCQFDCSEEDRINNKKNEECTENSSKKNEWEALFKKYEALEKECDSTSTTESEGIEMHHSSLTTIDSSEDDKKSCTEMLVTPLESSEDEKSCKNLILTPVEDSEKLISPIEDVRTNLTEMPTITKDSVSNKAKLSRLSNSSIDSTSDENIVTDMPLIQPVTSISVQHCETLYKAKVAKVLADEPPANKIHETEREISEEIFDVSLLCKKHLEKVQKSSVQVMSCVTKSEVHETKKRDCSPVILKKCEQWSIEKEKVLSSQRASSSPENLGRNPQFALTIAKFEQQKHSSEKESKKVQNTTSSSCSEKFSHDVLKDINKTQLPQNLFEYEKEKYTNNSDEVKFLDGNCSVANKSTRTCNPSDEKQRTEKTELRRKDCNGSMLLDKSLITRSFSDSHSSIKNRDSTSKNKDIQRTCSSEPFGLQQTNGMANYDYLGGKYYEVDESITKLEKNVHDETQIKNSADIKRNNILGTPSTENILKLPLKPLPLIPIVPKVNSSDFLVNCTEHDTKQNMEKVNYKCKSDTPLMKESTIKECNSQKGTISLDSNNEDKLDALQTNGNGNEKEAQLKILPRLREQYLNFVEKKNCAQPSPVSATKENNNKGRSVNLKSHTGNCIEGISKFEVQRSKFENGDKAMVGPKEGKKSSDSSKISTIISNFNLQKGSCEIKGKQFTKGIDSLNERQHSENSSKGTFISSKGNVVKKLLSSNSKLETPQSSDKIEVHIENSPSKKHDIYQSSCCSVFDQNMDNKLLPSVLRKARTNCGQPLPSGYIHLYHAGGYWTESLPHELRSNLSKDELLVKRGLYAIQPEPDSSRFLLQNGISSAASLEDEIIAGGFGVVRANTGRQLSDSRYRTELEIFFRSGVLAQLEAQRDERLTDHVVQLQACCRGYLARRKLAKLKIQDMAVRCIQRNVRKFILVREWPWWRLLVRVVPLLNVHRTEEQLRQKTEELEALRGKVEALEQERNHLKHDNDKLEAKLSEMTADLAEEHSTATLATERLEVETSERLRLEKDLQDVQTHNKNLSQQGERLEMELLCLRAADMNGVLGSEEDDEDGEGDNGVYKQRYERTLRELEFTRRRLQQQHEDDLEQLVALKKQLEKKLADAYEEVEEQRQVVAQWKRKVQKLNAEHNDLHLLLEEQNSRNNLLEKKQRKFDSELQLLQDELRQERQQHERASREKEMVLAEKYALEQNISGIRLELELKEDRVNSLTQELDELMFGGKTEEEVAHLKKTKHELEKKLKEQEEELDDLAGQVQLLEQSKLRLEMSLEQQRKESRRELAQRDEELEDVRCNAQKKVKALEAQLESEHDERTQLVRERHELERRLSVLEEQNRAARVTDEDTLHRLRRDLRRTKALLRDAQTMLERARGESPGKVVIRQLRNQLEDTEVARAASVKARQTAELELAETQAQLEEVQRVRQEAEERASSATRERSELQSQLEENEEELAEVLKKYRAAVQQLSVDQMALQEQAGRVAELESEGASLRDQLAEMTSRLENIETLGDPSSSLAQKRLELRVKELESKLELEQTTRARLEVQITRLKEAVEKLQDEIAGLRTKEQAAQDAARRLQRQLREAREEQATITTREQEAAHRRRELEKRLEAAEAEAAGARGDLRLALARIEDLQAAMQGELEEESSGSDPDRTESDHDSDGSDESINTFLANHKPRVNSSPKSSRPSLDLDISPKSLEVPAKKTVETTGKESFA